MHINMLFTQCQELVLSIDMVAHPMTRYFPGNVNWVKNSKKEGTSAWNENVRMMADVLSLTECTGQDISKVSTHAGSESTLCSSSVQIPEYCGLKWPQYGTATAITPRMKLIMPRRTTVALNVALLELSPPPPSSGPGVPGRPISGIILCSDACYSKGSGHSTLLPTNKISPQFILTDETVTKSGSNDWK